MHVQFALFADAANVPQKGKPNTLGVFDVLHVWQMPSVCARATFVVRLKAVAEDEGPHGVSREQVNPIGDMLWASRGGLLAVVDLPLDQPGIFTMIVAVDDTEATRTSLHVNQVMETLMPLTPAASA